VGKNYDINWNLNPQNFLANAAKIEAKLNDLDALAKKVGASLNVMPMQGGTVQWQGLLMYLQSINQQMQKLASQTHAAQQQLQNLNSTAGATQRMTHQASGGVSALTSQLKGLVSTAAALGVLKKVIGEIGEALKEGREAQEEKGRTSLDYRERVRELSNLMNTDADSAIANTFKFARSAAIGDWDQGRKFLEQFYGSSPAGVQKGNVREDQLLEVATESAIAARRLGIDEKTAGDMAGAMLQSHDINNQFDAQGRKMTPRQAVAGLWNAVGYGLNEGRGSISTLARSELQAAIPLLETGRARDHAEIASWVGVMSTVSKSAAFSGTAFAQMEAGLFRQDGEEGKFLKKAGIDKYNTVTERAMALRGYLEQNAAGQDWDAYLAKRGFGSRQERRSMIGGMANLDIFQRRYANARAMAADGQLGVQLGEEFLSSRTAADARSRVDTQGNQWLQGREMEPYMIGLQAAKARLEGRGMLDSQQAKLLDTLNDPLKLREFLGAKSELRTRIEREMLDHAQTAASNRGIDLEKMGLFRRDRDGNLVPRAKTEEIMRDLDVMQGGGPEWRKELYGQQAPLNNVPVMNQIGRDGGVDRGLGQPGMVMPPRGNGGPQAPGIPGQPQAALGGARGEALLASIDDSLKRIAAGGGNGLPDLAAENGPYRPGSV
jgi:hypothetical protein